MLQSKQTATSAEILSQAVDAPKKVFVWGFCDDLSDIIKNLENIGACDVRMWIGTPSAAKHPRCYDIFSFFSDHWLQLYKALYMSYTEKMRVSNETYTQLYKNIYKYIDMSSRHDKIYQCQDIHFYINSFNLLVNFFHAALQKEHIQAVIFSNIPHEGPDLILYQTCKLLKIQTIVLTQHPYIPNLITYSFNVEEEYGEFSKYFENLSHEYITINKKITYNFFYTHKKNSELRSSVILRSALSMSPLACIKNLLGAGLKMIRVRRYTRNMSTYSNDPDFSQKYCYFPLHFQPELTTSALGGYYTDQLLAIQRLSELLPDNWYIYVKDHPMQTEFMRPNIFFQRLLTIPKVVLIKNTVDTHQLIENAQFTSTITGTVGWESITSGKNTLIFGRIWYKNLPGVFTYSHDFNIEDILLYKIDGEELEKALNRIVLRMWPGVIDSAYRVIVKNYSHGKNTQMVSDLLVKMLFQSPTEAKL